MESRRRQIKCYRVPWNSMEIGGNPLKWHQDSTEFHGILQGIPWNSDGAKLNDTKFHEITWNLMIVGFNYTRFNYTSLQLL